MSIDAQGNIRIWAQGSTTLRFDTSGLINPSTYQSPTDPDAVSWLLRVEDRFDLPLERDVDNHTIFWFRFTEDHATTLGGNLHSYILLADFGTGTTTMGAGKISVVGL